MSRTRDGIDGLSSHLGFRWEAADRVRMTIRPDLINPAGLLSGAVAYALVDYCMGSTLWVERAEGEAIATIGISINYLQTATAGDVVCTSRLDRRNDRVAVLQSHVHHEDGRLLATAIGSFSIFPQDRLKERRPAGGFQSPQPG
jgi:acyl-CoA thioesterase